MKGGSHAHLGDAPTPAELAAAHEFMSDTPTDAELRAIIPPIPDTPAHTARACLKRHPKKDWRLLEEKKERQEGHAHE